MGSKNRIAKYILPIMLDEMKKNNCTLFLDACVGGANLIDKLPNNIKKQGNDLNNYLIAMWKELQKGWIPKYITKEEYQDIKQNKDKYEDFVVGYYGINTSFRGVWFSGFVGRIITKTNKERDYQIEALNNTLKQIQNLKDVEFTSYDIFDLDPIEKSLIYCDIPYRDTSGYKDKFNHDRFYDWCREMKQKGHIIFVSEYNMPSDFKEVWSMEVSSSLSANGNYGGNKKSIEKLFIL